MNDTLETILKRRSIRQYKNEQLEREQLEAIVEAGLCAPSTNNSQNWHFTIIQDTKMIQKVNEWVTKEIVKSGSTNLQEALDKDGGSIFRNAPTVIIVCSDKKDRFSGINCAAATENMLLAAQSIGIGSSWIGMVGVLTGSSEAETYAIALQAPEGYVPYIGITLGYRAIEDHPVPIKRENLVSYIL